MVVYGQNVTAMILKFIKLIYIERIIAMSTFLDRIKERAKADKKTVVLPESMDRRTLEAADKILREDIANIIIIGTKEEIEANNQGLDLSKATIIDPFTYEKTEGFRMMDQGSYETS